MRIRKDGKLSSIWKTSIPQLQLHNDHTKLHNQCKSSAWKSGLAYLSLFVSWIFRKIVSSNIDDMTVLIYMYLRRWVHNLTPGTTYAPWDWYYYVISWSTRSVSHDINKNRINPQNLQNDKYIYLLIVPIDLDEEHSFWYHVSLSLEIVVSIILISTDITWPKTNIKDRLMEDFVPQ